MTACTEVFVPSTRPEMAATVALAAGPPGISLAVVVVVDREAVVDLWGMLEGGLEMVEEFDLVGKETDLLVVEIDLEKVVDVDVKTRGANNTNTTISEAFWLGENAII
ncbi:hypothetical protein V8E54_011534 [Elaphomyces granulatus]